MAFTTNSGQFSQALIGDAANSLQDLTAYLDNFNISHGNDDTDTSTMAALGVATAETHTHGALTCQVGIDFVYNPVVAKVLRQIIGSRLGSTLRLYSGSNAVPTFGDEIFQGTFTLFDLQLAYNPGQTFMLKTTWLPTDGGALTPDYYTL